MRETVRSAGPDRVGGSSLLNEYGTHGRFPLSAVKKSLYPLADSGLGLRLYQRPDEPDSLYPL